MIERHVQTIYCDDIRKEVNGKLSYIGVYSGSLYVKKFPITLPKLALSVKVISPIDKPLESMTLRILKDEEIFQEIVVDKDQLEEASQALEGTLSEENNERLQLVQFIFIFSPFPIEKEFVLRVRVQTEDEELKGVALKIEEAPPEMEIIS